MAAIDLRSLVGKLDNRCRQALEAAAGLTLARTHYNVEIEHWLIKLLEGEESDAVRILRHYEIDPALVSADLGRVLDRLKAGNARPPALSPQLVNLAREAWILASLDCGANRIRSGHVLCALLSDSALAPLARESSNRLTAINGEALRRDLARIMADSGEAAEAGPAEDLSAAAGVPRSAGGGALDQFTIDLTAQARAGKIDPVLGRDPEIRQVIDILTRRRQNNPILTGEAGVGKTAVVEGFALRIAAGDVPEALRTVELRTLDLGLLQAGAGMKGEFENRLKSVIDDVHASPRPVILFIDEAHTLIGAGGQAGQNDAANLLKPALARGELRTIAATTWAEYKKYFERDAALTRRFQVVKVEEPAEGDAIAMMRGIVAMLEGHHKVRILDEAVVEAVRLSKRYISGRQLPDKSVSLLDTACARVSMSLAGTPAEVEDGRRSLERIDGEIAILRREEATGADHHQRLAEDLERRAAAAAALAALEARWGKEKTLAAEIVALRDRIEAAEESDALRPRFDAARAELKALQGETPMVHVCVDGAAVAAVVAAWTGIPVGRMVSDEIRAVLTLRERLEERVVGQSHALEAIARAVRTSRAGLTDPRKPLGVFLMCGTSGVGKTETAMALAELLYGGEQNMTVINMSEFKEEHKVSLLMGSPPGYVGYGEGGVLTEAVRRRPYSVVLLDEMEKAHPGVQDVFYQVFDKGQLKDGEGRDIDFRNCLIIMTSNAGTETIASLCQGPAALPAEEALTEALRPALMTFFKPAFLGRCTVVPYFPLRDEELKRIVRLNLDRVARRVAETYRARLGFGPEIVDHIALRCTETESGARAIECILNRTLLPQLAAEFLSRLAVGDAIASVEVGLAQGGFTLAVA